jgi:5-formyltetrahydrofolate cyclo-ligase
MTKTELRKALRARRDAAVAALGPNARLHALACAPLILAHMGDARIVAGYVAMGSELDAFPAIELAAARGLVTALPHIVSRAAPVRFLAWKPGDPLVPGPFGVRQPHFTARAVAPDLIIAPLIGFDAKLNRLGQGAGHYDRAFAAFPAARRIGLAWSCQQADAVPTDPWDMPLHGLVTERGWFDQGDEA